MQFRIYTYEYFYTYDLHCKVVTKGRKLIKLNIRKFINK